MRTMALESQKTEQYSLTIGLLPIQIAGHGIVFIGSMEYFRSSSLEHRIQFLRLLNSSRLPPYNK